MTTSKTNETRGAWALVIASLLSLIGVGLCWLGITNHLSGPYHTVWIAGLCFGAAAALLMLATVAGLGWQTVRGHCSIWLLAASLSTGIGLGATWILCLGFLARTP